MAQKLTADSKVWPYLTPWTVGEVKTAAWLVDNNHLTQLETVIFSSDLDTSSVSSQLDKIKPLAAKTFLFHDEQIFNKEKEKGK